MNTLFPHDLTPDPKCHVAAVRLFNDTAASDLRPELGGSRATTLHRRREGNRSQTTHAWLHLPA
jgi:hypothetical protein